MDDIVITDDFLDVLVHKKDSIENSRVTETVSTSKEIQPVQETKPVEQKDYTVSNTYTHAYEQYVNSPFNMNNIDKTIQDANSIIGYDGKRKEPYRSRVVRWTKPKEETSTQQPKAAQDTQQTKPVEQPPVEDIPTQSPTTPTQPVTPHVPFNAKDYQLGEYQVDNTVPNSSIQYEMPSIYRRSLEMPTKEPTLVDKLKDYYNIALNGITRKYYQYFSNDDETLGQASVVNVPTQESSENDSINNLEIEDEIPIIPSSYYGDTIKFGIASRKNYTVPNQYILPGSINLADYKFGIRNRGDKTPITTQGGIITAFNNFLPFDSNKKYSHGSYYGIDSEGNFKVGDYTDFEPGDYLTRTQSNDVIEILRNDDGTVKLKQSAKNSFAGSPITRVVQGNDTIEGGINFLSSSIKKYKSQNTVPVFNNGKQVGYASPYMFDGSRGGSIIATVGDEARLFTGSIANIADFFDEMKARYPDQPIRLYNVDNGTYSKGLRTTTGKLTSNILRMYDNQNTGGGNFLYIKRNGGSIRRALRNGGRLKARNGTSKIPTWQDILNAAEMARVEEAQREQVLRNSRIESADYTTQSNDKTIVVNNNPDIQQEYNTHLPEFEGDPLAWDKAHPNLASWRNLVSASPYIIASAPLAAGVSGAAGTVGSAIAKAATASRFAPIAQGIGTGLKLINTGLTARFAANGIHNTFQGNFTPMTALELAPIGIAGKALPAKLYDAETRAIEVAMRTGSSANPFPIMGSTISSMLHGRAGGTKRLFDIGKYILTGAKTGSKGYYNSFAYTPKDYYKGFRNRVMPRLTATTGNDFIDAALYGKTIDPAYGMTKVATGKDFGFHVDHVKQEYPNKLKNIQVYELNSPNAVPESSVVPVGRPHGAKEDSYLFRTLNGTTIDAGGHVEQFGIPVTIDASNIAKPKFIKAEDSWGFIPKRYAAKYIEAPIYLRPLINLGLNRVYKHVTPIISKSKWQRFIENGIDL